MRILLGALTLALAVPLVGSTADAMPPSRDLEWREVVVDADQSFRGLDAVNRRTAWVSGGSMTAGGAGSVWRTTDGGVTWHDVSPTGSEGLTFRDIEARSADTALALAIGPGEASRIYRTTDGGQTWEETFRNQDEAAFYNCMDFFPGGKRGLAVSDPVDGRFRILSTEDRGRSWEVLPDEGMPDSTGEYNFAASGDCLVISGKRAYFGSGGEASRIFHSSDRGLTWDATDSTIPSGEAAGVFGLAFKNPRQGVAVGGDFVAPDDGMDASAYTRDGSTWTNGGDLDTLGEDAAWLYGARRTLVSVGESGDTAGSHVSRDGGRTWDSFSDLGYHTLDCTTDKSCWAAGGGGRVGQL
jgi:photosystem II stability/assembly factor-like uncharacterized protein